MSEIIQYKAFKYLLITYKYMGQLGYFPLIYNNYFKSFWVKTEP